MGNVLQMMPLPNDMTVVCRYKTEDGIYHFDDPLTPFSSDSAYILVLEETEPGVTYINVYDSNCEYAAFGGLDEYGIDYESRVVSKKWLAKNPPEVAFGMKPRKLGKWLNHEGRKATCSVCGERQIVKIKDGNIITQFCAKCENPMDALFNDMTKRWRNAHE